MVKKKEKLVINKYGAALHKKSKSNPHGHQKKTFVVVETKTSTISTEYWIEANSKEEALENYRSEGEYAGDWSNSRDKEGVTVKERR